MAVLSFNVNFPGQSGVYPSEIIIETNDTLATVTTAGYLNGMVADNVPLVAGMMLQFLLRQALALTHQQVLGLMLYSPMVTGH